MIHDSYCHDDDYDDDVAVIMMMLMCWCLRHQFIWYNFICNVTETHDDNRYFDDDDDDDEICTILLFSLYFKCLNFASFLTAYLSASILFSTPPFMMRVWRYNAGKDCLVGIVGVIASGHFGQGRDSKCKAYYFYIHQFCLRLWSAWLHINMDVDDDDCHYDCDLLMMVMLLLLLIGLCVFSPS